MSHNASPTVTTNINIYYNSVNSNLKALGLEPIPSEDSVPLITQQALKQMMTALTAKFATTFPGQTLPPSNQDGGYCGPLSAVQPGVAPKCAVDQITQDFNNWGLSTSGVPTAIAQQIITEIISQGGQPGFASGTKQLTSAESMYWMCGYLNINITQTETGILYVFAATEGINI
ncbi:MAG: hypothetical protein V4581_16445 [Bacteroidota bacterium]